MYYSITLILILTITVFVACRKSSIWQTDETFNSEAAKEWYYSTFKKSSEFQTSIEKGKKLPDWKNGTYRKIGNIEIVEFPLMKEKTKLLIPRISELASSEINRIANSSLTRIAFIKSSSGNINVREIGYIPDGKYLQQKNYDISNLILEHSKNDFTGRMIIKKWNGIEILRFKMVDGIFSKKGFLRILVGSISNDAITTNSTNSIAVNGCVTYEVC